jgi:hypothetical protein
MESKQLTKSRPDVNTPKSGALIELSGHLADIELKLDHIIERLKDSLHSLNIQKGNEGDFP